MYSTFYDFLQIFLYQFEVLIYIILQCNKRIKALIKKRLMGYNEEKQK